MVAPHEIGDPVRSYVRVPGSGSDKTAKSLCCDLSRVSTVAAAAPIPPEHIRESQSTTSENGETNQNVDVKDNTRDSNLEEVLEKKDDSQIDEVPEQRQSTSSTSSSTFQNDHQPPSAESAGRSAPNPLKRPYQSTDTNIEEGRTRAEIPPSAKYARVTPVEGESSSRQDDSDQSISGVGANATDCEKPSTSSTGTQTTDLVSELMREHNQLKQQNIFLERRLGVFKDFFRDKKRLLRLLRALEVDVVETT